MLVFRNVAAYIPVRLVFASEDEFVEFLRFAHLMIIQSMVDRLDDKPVRARGYVIGAIKKTLAALPGHTAEFYIPDRVADDLSRSDGFDDHIPPVRSAIRQ